VGWYVQRKVLPGTLDEVLLVSMLTVMKRGLSHLIPKPFILFGNRDIMASSITHLSASCHSLFPRLPIPVLQSFSYPILTLCLWMGTGWDLKTDTFDGALIQL